MKKLRNYIFILLISIFVGLAALFIVYLLPTDRMEANVRSSIDIFYTEGVYPQQAKGYKSSQLDNETDAIMLLDAIHPAQNRSALENALRVSRITFSDTTSCCIDLIQYAWENKTPDQTVDYTRYWHGYLVWLKPLLLLMDYADLRMLNMMLQLLLLLTVIKYFLQKNLTGYLFPFAMSLIVLNPVSTAMSLQFSSIYYIVMLSMLIILKKHEYFYQKNLYPYLFFGLGIITVYFDFLTYPLAALCTPLILVLILEYKISLPNWTSTVRQTLILGICFGLGYVSMWFGKWAISSILLHENIIANAISEFTVHTGQTVIEGEAITKFGAIFRNLRVLLKWPYFIILGGYALYSLLKIDWRKAVHAFANIIPVLCVSLVPFAWIFVTSSHASWCYWYTYRGFIASIFGFYAALKMLPQKELYQSAK